MKRNKYADKKSNRFEIQTFPRKLENYHLTLLNLIFLEIKEKHFQRRKGKRCHQINYFFRCIASEVELGGIMVFINEL